MHFEAGQRYDESEQGHMPRRRVGKLLMTVAAARPPLHRLS